MEQNFQTSFIPKKPILEERAVSARSVSFSLVISIFILFTVLIASGGLYFYKGIAEKQIEQKKVDLQKAKNRFEPKTISQYQVLDKRLRAANEILSKHVAISPIFQALQEVTMKTVRFTKFSYSLGEEKNPKILVNMSGVAIGYRDIALQSDIFAKNENYGKYFIDPVFSNLSLDNSGNVLFDLEFSVDPTFIDYEEILKRAEAQPDIINTTVPNN
jgi:hypothetical protein